ncbi:hypothetical protein IE81DRAFT_158447 [Ceraceosorus guamensis]|uniref:Uncharacterized protein n=1 Tax=Ceraceosorus guamensis TaxID=1522189 RepID=A0A316VZP3_9BASI|nr:hypothetical protein IE81DRAFT_158447 [Ceraceosorus guamensis]PWN41751.1 hypothetical protein IE81DRAFT_158447 [Ceraceosorus guamensis]
MSYMRDAALQLAGLHLLRLAQFFHHQSNLSPYIPYQIHQPWCEPYGARRPIECALVTSTTSTRPSLNSTGSSSSSGTIKDPLPLDTRDWNIPQLDPSAFRRADEKGGVSHAPLVRMGYETCGRDVDATRNGWVSFLLLDLFLALGALFLLVQRQRLLASKHRNVLASRVGRGSSRA